MARKETVVVIEDEVQLIEIMRLFLEEAGYKVKSFSTGSEAIDWFKEHSDHTCCSALVDFKLPDVNGFECSRRLKELEPELPIAICSGFWDDSYSGSLQEYGISEFFVKPLNYSQIVSWVNDAC